MSIIIITNPAGTPDDCSGAALQLRYSNPDTRPRQPAERHRLPQAHPLHPALAEARAAARRPRRRGDHRADRRHPRRALPGRRHPVDPATSPTTPPTGRCSTRVSRPLLPRAGFLFQVMNLLSLTADAAPGSAARLLGADRHRRRQLPLREHVPHPDAAAAGSRRADRDGRQHRQRGRRADAPSINGVTRCCPTRCWPGRPRRTSPPRSPAPSTPAPHPTRSPDCR